MTDKSIRRHYDETFKRDAVQQLLASGKPLSVFAQTIGIERTNLQKWRKRYEREFLTAAEQVNKEWNAEKEVKLLRQEIDNLKDTVGNLRNIIKNTFTKRYSDE